ncbi:TPA: hypothetical protein I7258_23440 [Vibrio parahaemolyticus]|nr:hypothetical protein [Vibrio parahaemolyticus]
MKKFFKSNHADVYSAWTNYRNQVSKLKAECTAFAEHFDAKPAFVFSATGHAFGDLILNNPHTRPDAEFWTKPNSTRGNTSWIRQRVKGKENMNKLRELRAEYEKLKPECTDVSLDELYNTIGISWGDVVFSGIEWFAFEGDVYISTSLNLAKNVDEITAHEFSIAKKSKASIDKAA